MSKTGWRVIDLTQFEGKLSYQRGRLVLFKDSEKIAELPLVQLAVVLLGAKATIDGSVLVKLSQEGVALLICDWRNIPVAGASPWIEHSRIGARHQAQASISLPRTKNAWARIVTSKISAQSKVLKLLHNFEYSRLEKLSREVKSGDSDNREAVAAKIYWSALLQEEQDGRKPGAGLGGANGCLDYAYTILRGHGIRAVTSAGLCGSLGVFHRGRSNQYALVDDLIEPFRPVIDAFVFRN